VKPIFSVLRHHYPKFETRAELYAQIGWSDVVNSAAFKDTCAIRMSVGLLRAHVPLVGANMKAKAGPLKDQRIETGQGRLSNILKRGWGSPEVYRSEKDARDGIKQRTGVVSFFRIRQSGVPSNGGHIDLVFPAGNGFQECARSCYFESAEIWFWPLM
jgi:Type VI secretion system (T6SS), amidase effector protein 4